MYINNVNNLLYAVKNLHQQFRRSQLGDLVVWSSDKYTIYRENQKGTTKFWPCLWWETMNKTYMILDFQLR